MCGCSRNGVLQTASCDFHVARRKSVLTNLSTPACTQSSRVSGKPAAGRPGNTRRVRQVCRAGNKPFQLPTQLRPIVSSNIVQGSVGLIILAAIDAAYSGDWSRIGVISKDNEMWLQSALKALAAWHVVNALAAFAIASKNGRPTFPIAAKVLAIGTIPLVALILEEQEAA